MSEEMILPSALYSTKDFSPLQINDVTCIEYRSRKEIKKTKMLVTTSLFVVIMKGQKVLHTETGDIYISSGHAFFARKGAYLFSENLGEGQEFHSLIFFIDDLFLGDFLKLHPHLGAEKENPNNTPVVQIPFTPLLKNTAASFLPYFLHDSRRKNEILRLKLQELVLNLIEADQAGAFLSFLKQAWSDRQQSLVRVMEKYYTKQVTVKELAQLSGRSLSTFKREFQTTFGTTPKKWMNQRRLDQARILLMGRAHNVTEACFEVGFENVSHFSQLFKKKYGYSPGTLKNMQ